MKSVHGLAIAVVSTTIFAFVGFYLVKRFLPSVYTSILG